VQRGANDLGGVSLGGGGEKVLESFLGKQRKEEIPMGKKGDSPTLRGKKKGGKVEFCNMREKESCGNASQPGKTGLLLKKSSGRRKTATEGEGKKEVAGGKGGGENLYGVCGKGGA